MARRAGGERMKGKTATAPLRTIASATLGALAVGLLGSSVCVFSSHHCTDADGDGRCDHEYPPQPKSTDGAGEPWLEFTSAPAEVFRIEGYTLVVDTEEGVGETRRLEGVVGVSMLRIVPRSANDARSLRVFGDRVLAVNEDLLGLPRPRSFERIAALDPGFRLEYRVGTGGRVHLILDRLGTLVAVVSRAWSATPATPDADG